MIDTLISLITVIFSQSVHEYAYQNITLYTLNIYNFYLCIKPEVNLMKVEKEEIGSYLFSVATITLMPKLGKDSICQESYKTISFINIDEKSLTKY